MSLNAAAVQLLVDKGLSAQDIADVVAAAFQWRHLNECPICG